MAAKRLMDDDSSDESKEMESKRMRPTFAAVLREAVMVKSVQSFCESLEPMLRRVVNEEVQKGFARGAQIISRPPKLQIQIQEQSRYELCFARKLSLPIFTGSKIEDEFNQPIQLIIMETRGSQRVQVSLQYPIKIEIVVVNGEFSPDAENWTSEDFKKEIVKERNGKRPLITGEVIVTMRDGCVTVCDLTFTDNSSWIRSRKFRLGARVEEGSSSSSHGVRIREAVTEPFTVKDHRGELYRKHHPPALNDEVWRLEKIGKDGVFHGKLSAEGVNSVQDFLKLWVIEPSRLRAVLGAGMSDKMFEITITHAKECLLGNKNYVLRSSCYAIVLNPICQVVGVSVNGMPYPTSNLHGAQRMHVENLVREAYANWSSLEEVDACVNENSLLMLGT